MQQVAKESLTGLHAKIEVLRLQSRHASSFAERRAILTEIHNLCHILNVTSSSVGLNK